MKAEDVPVEKQALESSSEQQKEIGDEVKVDEVKVEARSDEEELKEAPKEAPAKAEVSEGNSHKLILDLNLFYYIKNLLNMTWGCYKKKRSKIICIRIFVKPL